MSYHIYFETERIYFKTQHSHSKYMPENKHTNKQAPFIGGNLNKTTSKKIN